MAIDPLSKMPDKLSAGLTLKVLRSYNDYHADAGWVVTFYFAGPTASFSEICTASGQDHLLTIAAADSANLAVDTYRWQAIAALAGENVLMEQGQLQVTPNFAAIGTAASDQRSANQIMLEALQGAFAKTATAGMLEFEVRTGTTLRRIKYLSQAELLTTINRYQFLVNKELNELKRSQGKKPNNNIYAEFR